MVHRTAHVLILITAGIGCGASETKPTRPGNPANGSATPTSTTTSATADTPDPANSPPAEGLARVLAFWDELATTTLADQNNCSKMTVDVNTLLDVKLKDMSEWTSQAVQHGWQVPQQGRNHLVAAIQKMGPSMNYCITRDDTTRSAFERLDVVMPHD